MQNQRFRQLLMKYLLGQAGEKEKTKVDEWYASFDRQELLHLPEKEADALRHEIWAAIEPVTLGESGDPEERWGTPIIPTTKKVRRLYQSWRAAAVLLLLAGAAGATYYLSNKSSCANCAVAMTELRTGVGEKKWMTLPDNSRLLLGAASTVKVYTDFARQRKVEVVDGEVFFDVKKDESRPFLVESQGLTTRVLGTSFTVAAYKELDRISIGVVSGKVEVANSASSLQTLTADQEIFYSKVAKTFKVTPLDESMTAWQQGRLVLNDLSFEEMTAIVRKNFGLDISTEDQTIKDTRYTTELLSSMPPAEVVEVLAAIHSLKILHKDNKILFHQ